MTGGKLFYHVVLVSTAQQHSSAISSFTQLCPTLWDSMDCSTPGLPYPSPTPRVLNSSPLSWWCHPTILSSVVPFSSCLQSFPASRSFPVSQFFTSGGQSIRVSASTSVLPMNIQDWSLLGWTGWISLQSKGLSSVFCNTTVQKHQAFFNFMIAVTICGAFGAPPNKVCHCFHCFPIYFPWSDGTRCHELSFLNVEF